MIKELLYRIYLYFNPPKEPMPSSVAVDGTSDKDDFLLGLSRGLGIPDEVIEECLKRSVLPHFAIIDMGARSSEKRLFIFNKDENRVELFHVAHGSKSDKGPGNTGWATKFSNIKNSHQTSLGIYRCAETYNSLKFGRALRLDGLSGFWNSNARQRAIVLHGSSYVEEKFIKKNGVAGRSQGCPAVGYEHRDRIIDCLAGGAILYIYKKGENVHEKE